MYMERTYRSDVSKNERFIDTSIGCVDIAYMSFGWVDKVASRGMRFGCGCRTTVIRRAPLRAHALLATQGPDRNRFIA